MHFLLTNTSVKIYRSIDLTNWIFLIVIVQIVISDNIYNIT